MPLIPRVLVSLSPSLVAVSPLLTIFGLLTGRAATMSTCDILLLLGLGLHLAIVLRLVTSASEVDAVLEDILKIVHCLYLFTVYSLRFTVDFLAKPFTAFDVIICKL